MTQQPSATGSVLRPSIACLGAMLMVLLCPTFAQADDPQPLGAGSDARVRSSNTTDRSLWIVGGALGTAMLLDTKSTFDVLGRCSLCYEANPATAPFVNRGPVVAFTGGALFDMGVMTVAARMKTSDKPTLRKIWWVAPVAIASAHLIAYRHNLNIAP